MAAETMTCMTCCNTRQYPDGFPDKAFAECWRCSFAKHLASNHRGLLRKVKRNARRRAKAQMQHVTDAELLGYVFGMDRELLQADARLRSGQDPTS